MRRVLIGDILALAGAIAERPDAKERALRLCDEAHAAHSCTKRLGHLHPVWGNGSLMSRAFAAGDRMQSDWGDEGLAALAIACEALRLWRGQRLDCRAPRLCAILEHTHEESADGRNPAQTEQHRSGLGARLPRGQ